MITQSCWWLNCQIYVETDNTFFLSFFHIFLQSGAVYIEEFIDDLYMLPAFPLAKPAEFQILESDCKINAALVTQLKQKFFETQSIEMAAFVVNNLDKMLTYETASLYSWNGQQGYIPVMRFRTMKTLIGSWPPTRKHKIR